jgi:hypothetical protein
MDSMLARYKQLLDEKERLSKNPEEESLEAELDASNSEPIEEPQDGGATVASEPLPSGGNKVRQKWTKMGPPDILDDESAGPLVGAAFTNPNEPSRNVASVEDDEDTKTLLASPEWTEDASREPASAPKVGRLAAAKYFSKYNPKFEEVKTPVTDQALAKYNEQKTTSSTGEKAIPEKYLELLTALQQSRQPKLDSLGMLAAGDEISRGLTKTFGGKLDSGLDSLKFLKDLSEDQLKNIQFLLKNSKDMYLNPKDAARLEYFKANLGDRQKRTAIADERMKQTEQKHITKLATDMNKALDVAKLSKTSDIGRSMFSYGAANNLKVLLSSKPADEFTDVEIEEIARITDRMLSGGSNAARSAVESLVPSTLKGNIIGIKQWFTNTAEERGAASFVDVFQKLADRIATYDENIILSNMKSNLAPFMELKMKAPILYNDIMSGKFEHISLHGELGAKSKEQLIETNKALKNEVMTQDPNDLELPTPDGAVRIMDPDGEYHFVKEGAEDKYLDMGWELAEDME